MQSSSSYRCSPTALISLGITYSVNIAYRLKSFNGHTLTVPCFWNKRPRELILNNFVSYSVDHICWFFLFLVTSTKWYCTLAKFLTVTCRSWGCSLAAPYVDRFCCQILSFATSSNAVCAVACPAHLRAEYCSFHELEYWKKTTSSTCICFSFPNYVRARRNPCSATIW